MCDVRRQDMAEKYLVESKLFIGLCTCERYGLRANLRHFAAFSSGVSVLASHQVEIDRGKTNNGRKCRKNVRTNERKKDENHIFAKEEKQRRKSFLSFEFCKRTCLLI